MLHCLHGTGIIIHHYTVRANTYTYPVVKNEWNIIVEYLLKMIVGIGFFRKTGEHPRYPCTNERTGNFEFFLIAFVRLAKYEIKPLTESNFFDARNNGGKEIMYNFRNNYSYRIVSFHTQV